MQAGQAFLSTLTVFHLQSKSPPLPFCKGSSRPRADCWEQEATREMSAPYCRSFGSKSDNPPALSRVCYQIATQARLTDPPSHPRYRVEEPANILKVLLLACCYQLVSGLAR